jgi:hypothetical protein
MPNDWSFNLESMAARERESLEPRCVESLLVVYLPCVPAISDRCQKRVPVPIRGQWPASPTTIQSRNNVSIVVQMSDSHASDGQEVRLSGHVSDRHSPGHISSEVGDGLV